MKISDTVLAKAQEVLRVSDAIQLNLFGSRPKSTNEAKEAHSPDGFFDYTKMKQRDAIKVLEIALEVLREIEEETTQGRAHDSGGRIGG